jgi:hypothetical protein
MAHPMGEGSFRDASEIGPRTGFGPTDGWTTSSIYAVIKNSYMVHESTSTVRARRLRERSSRGITMVATVEVGEGGIELLVGNGLLKQHQIADRKAVGEACLAAL